MVDESKAEVSASLLVLDLVALTGLDVIVLPSGKLIGLALGQPPGTAVVVKRGSDKTSSYQIDGIMVAQIHGCPPNPAGVRCKEELELGEAVAHEQGLKNSVRSVERGESTKRQRGIGEVGSVQINTKNGINASQSSGRSVHAVGCRNKSVLILIPWRRAGEDELNGDTEDAHPAESTSKDRSGAGSREDEHDCGAHSRGSEVNDAVGKPSQNVENSMLVSRENVGKVRAIENVFQSRQDSDPDMRTILGRNKSKERK